MLATRERRYWCQCWHHLNLWQLYSQWPLDWWNAMRSTINHHHRSSTQTKTAVPKTASLSTGFCLVGNNCTFVINNCWTTFNNLLPLVHHLTWLWAYTQLFYIMHTHMHKTFYSIYSPVNQRQCDFRAIEGDNLAPRRYVRNCREWTPIQPARQPKMVMRGERL